MEPPVSTVPLLGLQVHFFWRPIFIGGRCAIPTGAGLTSGCGLPTWVLGIEPSLHPLEYLSAKSVLSFRLSPALLDPYIGRSLLLCLLMNSPHPGDCKIITVHSSHTGCLALPVCLSSPLIFVTFPPLPIQSQVLYRRPIVAVSWAHVN